MKQKARGRTTPVVKLFKRKSQQKTRDFKFDTSLKIKSLPLEEYAHVAYAFKVATLRFERMLKESLLEGYITSTTLEKISRDFRIATVRNIEIPETTSLREIFGSDLPESIAKEKPRIDVEPTPKTKPIEPEVPSTIPSPQPLTEIKPSPTPMMEPSEKRPKISFNFPETSTEPTTTPSPSSPAATSSVEPKTEISPPTIPKISFPSLAKPPTTPSIGPLSQPKGGREEDRATGIAILRKQMLTELKKIRSVVSEQDR